MKKYIKSLTVPILLGMSFGLLADPTQASTKDDAEKTTRIIKSKHPEAIRSIRQETVDYISAKLPVQGFWFWQVYKNYFLSCVTAQMPGVVWRYPGGRIDMDINVDKLQAYIDGKIADLIAAKTKQDIVARIERLAVFGDHKRHVYQLPVLFQRSRGQESDVHVTRGIGEQKVIDEVLKDDSTYCGYHALKNAYGLLNIVRRPTTSPDTLIIALTDEASYADILQNWKSIVVARRMAKKETAFFKDGIWTDDYLIKEDLSLLREIDGRTEKDISIIENLDLKDPIATQVQELPSLRAMHAIVTEDQELGTAFVLQGKIRNANMFKTVYERLAKEREWSHAFVISLARQPSGDPAKSLKHRGRTHWVTVVVHKHAGVVNCYVTDSGSPQRARRPVYGTFAQVRQVLQYFGKLNETA